jgi:antirestriction protein ArdC
MGIAGYLLLARMTGRIIELTSKAPADPFDKDIIVAALEAKRNAADHQAAEAEATGRDMISLRFSARAEAFEEAIAEVKAPNLLDRLGYGGGQ